MGERDGKMKETARKSTGVAVAGKKNARAMCRVCLSPHPTNKMAGLFTTWTWPQPLRDVNMTPVCVGDYLSKVSGVQISPNDGYSQQLCYGCLSSFKAMLWFLSAVQQGDRIVRSEPLARALPGPIRFDPTAVGVTARGKLPERSDEVAASTEPASPPEMMIKEELVSEEEREADAGPCALDIKQEIKIEPEELVAQYRSAGEVQGPEAMDGFQQTSGIVISSSFSVEPDQIESLEAAVKEELEEDMEVDSDVSLDCLLCQKMFLTLSGLRAHVISSHSYKSVHRTMNGGVKSGRVGKGKHRTKGDRAGEERACFACAKRFSTKESLDIHERIHNTVCPRCDDCFSSFVLLTQHMQCCSESKANVGGSGVKRASRTKTVRQLKREHTDEEDVLQNENKVNTITECVNHLKETIGNKLSIPKEGAEDRIKSSDAIGNTKKEESENSVNNVLEHNMPMQPRFTRLSRQKNVELKEKTDPGPLKKNVTKEIAVIPPATTHMAGVTDNENVNEVTTGPRKCNVNSKEKFNKGKKTVKSNRLNKRGKIAENNISDKKVQCEEHSENISDFNDMEEAVDSIAKDLKTVENGKIQREEDSTPLATESVISKCENIKKKVIFRDDSAALEINQI